MRASMMLGFTGTSILEPRSCFRQGLPDLLGDERHEGVEQAQEVFEDEPEDVLGRCLAYLGSPL